MKKLVVLAVLLLIALSGSTASAHANLLRSEPAGGASLTSTPSEIRLWFTEPLEPSFSSIVLRDSTGGVITAPHSQVEGSDQTELVMQPGELPDGLYTVSWRVLSTDGHTTEGSFAFGIGVAVLSTTQAPTIEETIPVESVLIRWGNLFTLSLGVGSLGFWLFVWRSSVPQGQADIEQQMKRIIWLGWLLIGTAIIGQLLLQVSSAAGISILEAITDPALGVVLGNSYYGQIWLVRLLVWFGGCAALLFAGHQPRFYLAAFVLGLALLMTNSLYSHASATQQDTLVTVLADWLHLAATVVWIGGLIQFFAVIRPVMRHTGGTDTLSALVGNFSNLARISVGSLIISGLYAAWLHVGSVEALLTTTYGLALLVKLILIVPLLAISAVNLVLTQRGLHEGQLLWAGRLRGLVGAEIVLTITILAAVGVMTAIAPARTVLAVREAAPPEPVIQPYFEMQMAENLMAHLEITPGSVGENTFVVTLYDREGGQAVTDATRIRLRFENQENDIGQSELRPTLQSDGTYSISGANLSIPGQWNIRMTVQRPDEFDTLMDFQPSIELPAPVVTPVIDTSIPAKTQWLVLILTGLALLIVGGFFIAQYDPRSQTAPAFGAMIIIAVGMVFLFSAVGTAVATAGETGELSVRDAWTLPLNQGMTGGVFMTIDNRTNQAERLIGATTNVSDSVEIHATRIDDNYARMRLSEGLDIPAGSSLSILPGRYHLMLVNLHRDLSLGETITVNLHFESGRELTVTVPVQYTAQSQS